MASKSKAFVVGVGLSSVSSGSSQDQQFNAALVSATTKALLDAGLTFDDITQGVASKEGKSHQGTSETFKAFGKGLAISQVKQASELVNALRWVRDRGARSVLVVAAEESAAIALVVVSNSFLASRPYLQDSAVYVREADTAETGSNAPENKMLSDVGRSVWMLRGWSNDRRADGKNIQMVYRGEGGQIIEMTRADGNKIPKWKDVEFRPDGKHRLGYNPATATKEVSREDFEAVRAVQKGTNNASEWTQFKRKGGDRAALSRL